MAEAEGDAVEGHVLRADAPDDGMKMVVHNHLTRNLESPGVCPKCDLWWDKHGVPSPTDDSPSDDRLRPD